MTINLSPQELQKANSYAEKIDLNNSAVIMQYAAPVQRRITSYSGQALEIATGNASNEAVEIINQLISKISRFATPRKGLFGLGKKSTEDWRSEYQATSRDIKTLALQLERIQFQLYKDMGLYQEMAKQNQDARQELLLYLQAGKTRLETAQKLELPMMETKYLTSPTSQSGMILSDYEAQVDQFAKKLQDLQVTKIISEQFEAQLDLMYQTAQTLSEKLQATITHTIPLWQNQVAIALGLDNIRRAKDTDRAINQVDFADPAEKISQLTTQIIQDIDDKKTELQELGQSNT